MPVLITRDTSIDYDVHGEGPSLLLLSGLGFGRWGWFKQVPALSRHFRTITYDIRSVQKLTGVTDLVAKAVALLDHLGIEKTHVLGTSLGGFVAQKLALERSDLVDRLVLVCTSYGGREAQPMSPQALGRMFGSGSLNPESAVRRGLEAAASGAYRSRHSEEFKQIVRWRLADSPSLPNFYKQAMAGARFDGSREVNRIAAPTLVIHGAADCYVPAANAVALAKAIPGAKLRVLEDAGHLVFIEQAKEVNEEVVSFLKPRQSRKRHKLEKLAAPQRTAFLHELGTRWRHKKVWAGQKTSQLAEWFEEAQREIASSFKFAKPQRKPRTQWASKMGEAQAGPKLRKAAKSFAGAKNAGRLHAPRKAASVWEKRLRSWLSLAP